MQALQFNVSKLLREGTGSSRRYQLDDDVAELTDEVKVLALLKGAITFVRTVTGVLVTGHLETVVMLTCRRCAIEFPAPVEIELEEEFKATYDVETGLPLPRSEDDDEAALINEQHILDLSEVLRQDLLLALPPFPLCREDCAGICPHCGQDLNEGPCACTQEEVDPRWGALRDLLTRGVP